MKIPELIRRRLAEWANDKIANTKPDFIIGEESDPYLKRWYIIPHNRFFNIYLHHFLRSDDDRALHDHPWVNCSILLAGEYVEWVPHANHQLWPGDTPTRPYGRKEGHIYFRRAKSAHRVELNRMKTEIIQRGDLNMSDGRVLRLDESSVVLGPEIPVITLFITGSKIREWGFHCAKGWRHWEEFVSKRDGGNAVGRGCE